MSEYTLVDCKTSLIYGPFESLQRARQEAIALELEDWEIHNPEGAIVDWDKS